MAPAAPRPPSAPRSRGVTKNLIIVTLALLVGAGVAVGVLQRLHPARPLPLEPPRLFEPPLPSESLIRGTEAPRARAVWCEGLPVERCGEQPEACRVSVYCDGVRFCTARRQDAREPECGAHGYTSASAACCPGLVPRCGVLEPDGTCDSQLGTERQPMCLSCGDGVCDVLEQRCNCAEDCVPSAKLPKVRYRGSRPEGPREGDGNVPARVTRPGQCVEALREPDDVRQCLVTWAHALFGRSGAAELRWAEKQEPFTPFDVDLLECLDLLPEDSTPSDKTSREDCLEALSLRTRDSRLDPLLGRTPSTRSAR